jgi:hypothetical protein
MKPLRCKDYQGLAAPPCNMSATPLIEPAVLTIGSASVSINGDQVGEIFAQNNVIGSIVTQLHRAYDANGNVVETSIFNYDGTLPASITTPFVYQVMSTDGGSADFSAFGAFGDLSIATLTYSLTPAPVPIPPTLSLFATGLGLMGLFAWRRKRRAGAAA